MGHIFLRLPLFSRCFLKKPFILVAVVIKSLLLVAFGFYLFKYQWSKILFDIFLLAIPFLMFLYRHHDFKVVQISYHSYVWMLFLFVSALGYWLLYGQGAWQWSDWNKETQLPFLNALLLSVLISSVRIYLVNFLPTVLLISATLGGVSGLFQYLSSEDMIRASGGLNFPVFYGGILMVLAAMIGFYAFQVQGWQRVLAFLAFTVAASGIVCSGTRSAILVLICYTMAFLGWWLRAWIKKQDSWHLGLLLLIGVCVLLWVTYPVLYARFLDLKTEIETLNYSSGVVANHSIGTRVNFWLHAIDAWQQSPWVGMGFEGSQDFIVALNAKFDGRLFTAGAVHPHADVLFALYAGGLAGVCLLLFLYVFPIYFCYRYGRPGAVIWVLIFVAGFALVGLADAYLIYTIGIKYYLCVLTLMCLTFLKSDAISGTNSTRL